MEIFSNLPNLQERLQKQRLKLHAYLLNLWIWVGARGAGGGLHSWFNVCGSRFIINGLNTALKAMTDNPITPIHYQEVYCQELEKKQVIGSRFFLST